MKCPACNQSATTFLRNALTLQGVSFSQSVQGYLTCHRCGVLLRVTGFGKQFWFFFIPTVVALFLYVFLYRHLIALIGMDATTVIWIVLVLSIGGIFTLGLWKFARVSVVETEAATKPGADEQKIL
jgi:membrane-associated HD superfamily phosphohydrolase